MTPPARAPETADALRPPTTLSGLFWAFTRLALQGFGGVMAVAQQELVERQRWMDRSTFLEDWAVAQVLPGPNVANLAVMLGDRYLGWRGALVSVLGLFALPLLIVLALALLFAGLQSWPAVQGALRGMGLVVAGLIAVSALRLLPALRQHVGGPLFCFVSLVATLVALLILKWSLPAVLAVVGTLSCLWTYRALRRAQP
ncbi:chromate transporter [Amphibiibacter pelophylacis]|uniref:Chromate transporter n=1 Tax=Amphibiibacter pelophylacis TaxID=1799477 RepID=A0ACC6NYF4_9BURK